MDFEKLKWDSNGLIPAVVQDAYSGEVLTVAYMNRESLAISLEEKRTCFYSRSRQELWRKGETSGNTQKIISIVADCDQDALVVKVEKVGPACHTGAESCFFQEIYKDEDFSEPFSVDALYAMISGRKEKPMEGSYTSYLFEKGIDKILKKVGEESTEVIIAAKGADRPETVYEIADVAYHVLVLMVEMEVTPEEIRAELANRHVVDYKVKQEYMN